MGPSGQVPTANPHGNSSDPRETFFQPARFADVCRRALKVCRRVQTFAECLQTCADFRPGNPGLCTMPAREAWFVHNPSKGSLVRAQPQQGKLGSCHRARSPSAAAAGYHGGRRQRARSPSAAAGSLGDHDHCLIPSPTSIFHLPGRIANA